MRERKFKNNAEQEPTNVLRRSPRFLHRNQITVENPATPKPSARKLSSHDSFSSCITKSQKNSDGISQNGGRKGTKSRTSAKSSKRSTTSARFDHEANFSGPDLQKHFVIEKRVTRSSIGGSRFVMSEIECDGISGKRDREHKSSEKSGEGIRRSARLRDRANVSKSEQVLSPRKQYVIEKRVTRSSIRGNRVVTFEVGYSDFVSKSVEILSSQKQYVIERRVTRSSVRGNKVLYFEVSDSDSEADSCERGRILSKERKARVGVDFCEKNIGNVEKKDTHSSSETKGKPKGDHEFSKHYRNERDVKDCGTGMRGGDKNCRRKTGEKRKRYQVEEEGEFVQGWTKEQELALQKAYFTAKPTPQFWKKVARMVPGKSAEECFDRIHLDHLTPLQPQTRSRARKKETSPISFSASKLLSPAEMKSKKLKSRRRTLLAQKTVRQLLQKQHNEDKDYEADFFAVLEPTMDPSPLSFQEGTAFASPAPKRGSGKNANCRQMSSSVQRKHLSRLNSSHKAGFVSPPVLKQIKNKALHEKYIDQLHSRDAKRMAESLRKAKNINDQIDEKENHLKPDLVKVAKDTLVSNARDAINQFQSLQSETNYSIDDDDNTSCTDEDEDDDDFANL